MLAPAHRPSRLLAAVVLLAAALALPPAVPGPLRAGPDCTTEYENCLNESRQKPAILREMGYVECLAEWTGCVMGKL